VDTIEEFKVLDGEMHGLVSGGVVGDYGRRRILGLNMETTYDGPWHNFYSDLFKPVFESIHMRDAVSNAVNDFPTDLIPTLTDTRESLYERIKASNYYDERYNMVNNKLQSLNMNSKQARRRTSSVVVKHAHPCDSIDGEGFGEAVMTLMAYGQYDGPYDSIRCVPLRNKNFALVLCCWIVTWPRLTDVCKRYPPNSLQIQTYYATFLSEIEKHRDNNSQKDLVRIINGGTAEVPNKKYGAMKNSQIFASNVIVYTTGNRPMTMSFWYSRTPEELTLDRGIHYRTNEDFQFQCMDGWLTVLDPIDDLLMCHDVKFKISNPQDDVEGYRVAWIMRWLGQPQDFFVETSGMRRTQDMLRLQGDRRRVDDMFPERVRDILS
jgi:hypothetical protein